MLKMKIVDTFGNVRVLEKAEFDMNRRMILEYDGESVKRIWNFDYLAYVEVLENGEEG